MIEQSRLDQFKRILDVVRWEFPDSHPVIGGGALRDSILNRPIKDVDVFMRAKDHITLDSELTRKIHTPIIYQLYGRSDMYGAWNLSQQIEGYDVQLILADFEQKEDLAHTFDIGLSRVTYDGDSLYVSDEFLTDAADKALRIRRADNDHELERSLRRVERLREKYQDFRHDITDVERGLTKDQTFIWPQSLSC